MLVFLDIDGVMVPATSWRKPEFLPDGFPMFSFRAIQALKRIVGTTNAKIILTTSHKSRYSISEWIDIFKSRGLTFTDVQRLPENVHHLNRKDELINWFNINDINEHFVIIDDEKSLNELPNFLKRNLVLTSGSVGLTDELAEEAINILTNRAPALA